MTDPTLIRDLIRAGVDAELVARVVAATSGTPRRQTRPLPADWMPAEQDTEALRELGWRGAEIEAEVMRFRDHARSKGRREVEWDAAFRNWMRSPYLERGPEHDRKSVLAAADRLAERTGGNARDYKPGTAGPGELDLGPGPDGVRRLPKR
jgi:hypothetical protein